MFSIGDILTKQKRDCDIVNWDAEEFIFDSDSNIIEVDVSGLGLSGVVDWKIEWPTTITSINFANNPDLSGELNFTGQFPRVLETLDISNCSFSGD